MKEKEQAVLRNTPPGAGRHAPRARRRVGFRLVATLGALVTVTAIGTAPSVADPPAPTPPTGAHLSDRIRAVNHQLDRLGRQTEQLDEKYDVAVAAVATSQRAATRAEQASQAAALRYQAAHARFVDLVRQRYETAPGASVSTLLTSDSPQDYLDALTVTEYLSGRLAATVRGERTARTQADQAARRARTALAAARTQRTALAERRTVLQRQSQRIRQLLGTLTVQQQRERARARAVSAARARATLHPTPPAGPAKAHAPVHGPAPVAVNVSGSVQRVIDFAEAQVGKAYGYGASGPDAYDCSGLTMAAWAKAGVHLPHSAAAQYGYGTHVSYGDLQPGDLIFLYSPIGHVELYVGHDLAVSAADYGIGVVYVHPSRDRADFAGATRLTG